MKLCEILEVRILNAVFISEEDPLIGISCEEIDENSEVIIKCDYGDYSIDWNEHSLVNFLKSQFVYYGNGYCITSFRDFDGTWFSNISGSAHNHSSQGESEAEAVFKTVKWIVDLEDENDRIEKEAVLEEQYNNGEPK